MWTATDLRKVSGPLVKMRRSRLYQARPEIGLSDLYSSFEPWVEGLDSDSPRTHSSTTPARH